MARPFSHRVESRTIFLSGDLDLSTASALEGALDGITEQPGDLIVDATDLTFLDSSGVRVLFSLARRLGDRGRLVIANPRDQVLRVLDLVHAKSVLDVRMNHRTDA